MNFISCRIKSIKSYINDRAMPYLYATSHSSGVRIKYCSDLPSKDKVIVLDSESVDSDESVEILKKLAKEMSITTKSADVYHVTPQQASILMKAISTRGASLSTTSLNRLMGSRQETMSMSYSEIKEDIEEGRLKVFEINSSINNESIDDIQHYIETSCVKDDYFMPPIIVHVNKDDSMEILDGNHRCAAIRKIHKSHLCMNVQMTVIVYRNLTLVEKWRLTNNINKTDPTKKFSIHPTKIKQILEELLKLLTTHFGPRVIISNEKTRKPAIEFHMDIKKINKFVNSDNLLKLIFKGDLTEVSAEGVFELLKRLNIKLQSDILKKSKTKSLEDVIKKEEEGDMADLIDWYTNINTPPKNSTEKKKKDIKTSTLISAIKKILKNPHNPIKKGTPASTARMKISEPFMLGLIRHESIIDVWANLSSQ